ncbi:regulatory protein RecX [Apibacter muscae]|uniref:regulatory protein RecX n=1 Tax=Apibacter muscae TaxID=2509004 RepID=UPI001FE8511E|nr:regulatory protein RecX [Apibacter muscae]
MYTVSDIKKKLASYCAYQDRCHWEVEEKLKEYYFLDDEEKGGILVWLIQNDFLNEERFALSYTRGKFNLKKWGKIKIRQKLKQKKIPERLILLSFEEIDEQDYIKSLEKIAETKWNSLKNESILIKKKKLISYLIQKGYEFELIQNSIDSLVNKE